MLPFNVLDRHLNIHQSYLLEASAGTGKTFAIEHLTTRLLLEVSPGAAEPWVLSDLLIVTFTRMAVRDLRTRIHTALHSALECLRSGSQNAPDYLLAIQEAGEQAVDAACYRLRYALFEFDRAEIYTIHAFSSRMLALHGYMQPNGGDDLVFSPLKLRSVLYDALRTELIGTEFSPQQLARLIGYCGSFDDLVAALEKLVALARSIEPQPSFADALRELCTLHQGFRSHYPMLDRDKVIADFAFQAPSYKKLCDKKGNVKPDIREKVGRMAELLGAPCIDEVAFNELIKEGVALIDYLDPSQLMKKAKVPSPDALHYPDLTRYLRSYIAPIVQRSRHPPALLARLAALCQLHVQRYCDAEELCSYDVLLQKMRFHTADPVFASALRQRYKASIIDEFQDTDPCQWELVKNIFLEPQESRRLYLVGDPKQSIYAFRQADIYTYLAAASALGSQNRASLSVNYRSTPSLIGALNALLSAMSAEQFIPLPRIDSYLAYSPVTAGTSGSTPLTDEKASVQWWQVDAGPTSRLPLENIEEEYVFPRLVEELRLLQGQGVALNDCAALVSDRYQGQRLAIFCRRHHIDISWQRSFPLKSHPMLAAWAELLNALLQPKDFSAVKIALAGPFIGCQSYEIGLVDADEGVREAYFLKFAQLRRGFLEGGIAALLPLLWDMSWHGGEVSAAERLLAEEGGIERYNGAQQIAELLLAEEAKGISPYQLAMCIESWQVAGNAICPPIKNNSGVALNLLTVHASKGLEYGVVFAVGLMRRPPAPDLLVPRDGSLVAAFNAEDEAYLAHCQELDAEKMRQLYVAMTRAKWRLYLPVIFCPSRQPLAAATASPIELFASRICQPAASYRELYARIKNSDSTALNSFIEDRGADYSIAIEKLEAKRLSACDALSVTNRLADEPTLFQPSYSYHTVYSFTVLADRKEVKSSLCPPFDWHNAIKTPFTLPVGKESGLYLHNLLSAIPWHIVAQACSPSDLTEAVSSHLKAPHHKIWAEVWAKLVFNALRTCLWEGISLADPFCTCLWREVPFLLPHLESHPVQGMRQGDWLRGVIDAVVCFEGKYYIVEWKSHWLGPLIEDYGFEAMQKALDEGGYYLQSRIYAEALRRYLAGCGLVDFNKVFGGVFFLFPRGLDPEKNFSTGIFLDRVPSVRNAH